MISELSTVTCRRSNVDNDFCSVNFSTKHYLIYGLIYSTA